MGSETLMHIDVDMIDEVLATARSVRRNLDFETPLPRQVLLDCIDVAVQAPTGIAGENWRFVVVDAPAPKAKIAAIYKEVLLNIFRERDMPMKPTHKALIERLHKIPAMIFVCVEGEPMDTAASSQIGFYGSILPAAWSLMLALRARGIGTTWTSLLSARQDEVREILGMPPGSMHTIMLPAGYTQGAKLKRAAREPASAVTYWNAWDHNGNGE